MQCGWLCCRTAAYIGHVVELELVDKGADTVCPPVCCAAPCFRFATRISNVFVIGRGNKPLVTLPKGKGVRPTILQEQAKRFGSA